MTAGNAYEDSDATPLPTDMQQAIDLARGSDFLKDLIGADLHEILCQQSEREIEFLSQQVTPLEIERYLGNL